jgi:hypothetical protein
VKIKLFLYICVANSVAWPQTQSGTVVDIVGFEQGPVAVSADSRQYYRDGRTSAVCKIATLGNKLIVSVTGYAGSGNGFSVLADAREVFNSTPSTQRTVKDFGLKFVELWRDSLLEHINRELDAGRLSPAFTDGPRLLNGIVVGRDEKGLVTFWVIPVSIEQSSDRYIAVSRNIETGNRLPLFNALGRQEIAAETYYGKTDRGKAWNRKLWKGSDTLPTNQKSTYWSRWLVQLTVDNWPPESIGNLKIKTVAGPIDTATIDDAGRVKWGKHQAQCQ